MIPVQCGHCGVRGSLPKLASLVVCAQCFSDDVGLYEGRNKGLGTFLAVSEQEMADLTHLPPLEVAKAAPGACRSCGTSLFGTVEKTAGLCPNCAADDGSPMRNRQRLVRTIDGRTTTAGLQVEAFQYRAITVPSGTHPLDYLKGEIAKTRNKVRSGPYTGETKLKGNTLTGYQDPNGDYHVRYHDTPIVSWKGDGSKVTYRTGGWHSPSTRTAIEEWGMPGHRIARQGRTRKWTISDFNVPPSDQSDHVHPEGHDSADLVRHLVEDHDQRHLTGDPAELQRRHDAGELDGPGGNWVHRNHLEQHTPRVSWDSAVTHPFHSGMSFDTTTGAPDYTGARTEQVESPARGDYNPMHSEHDPTESPRTPTPQRLPRRYRDNPGPSYPPRPSRNYLDPSDPSNYDPNPFTPRGSSDRNRLQTHMQEGHGSTFSGLDEMSHADLEHDHEMLHDPDRGGADHEHTSGEFGHSYGFDPQEHRRRLQEADRSYADSTDGGMSVRQPRTQPATRIDHPTSSFLPWHIQDQHSPNYSSSERYHEQDHNFYHEQEHFRGEPHTHGESAPASAPYSSPEEYDPSNIEHAKHRIKELENEDVRPGEHIEDYTRRMREGDTERFNLKSQHGLLPKLQVRRVQSALLAKVVADNPGITRREAHALADRVIARYPALVS